MASISVKHVLHVIPNLDQGGAERVLLNIVEVDSNNRHSVIKLFSGSGLFDERVARAAVGVHCLGLPRTPLAFLLLPLALVRLIWLLLAISPTVVVGWLYYGALVASVGRLLRLPVVWSLHAADFDPATTFNAVTRAAVRLCRMLSGHAPTVIHYCSDASRNHHERLGFAGGKSAVIENGVAIDRMSAAPSKGVLSADTERIGVGRRLGAKVICCIARFEPQKDHRTLLRAVAELKAKGRQFSLVLSGRGCSHDNRSLKALLDEFDLHSEVVPVGVISQVERLLQCGDAVVLSSSEGEALPMVLLEALAMSKPVVATAVGSVPRLVGEFGLIVPPKNPSALAHALERVLWQEPSTWASAAALAPALIRERYSQERMVRRWNDLYLRLAPS